MRDSAKCGFPVVLWGDGNLESTKVKPCGAAAQWRLLCRVPLVSRAGWDYVCTAHRDVARAEAATGTAGFELVTITEV